MEFKDYYQILGVEPDAELKDIKIAYRKLARKYHPDLNPDPGAEASFKEVAEAWEVLKDSGRRAEYDELRRYGGRRDQQFEPPPGWHSAAGTGSQQFDGDFSDFFNSIFGAGFRQQGPAGDYSRPGQDVEIELPLFLEETLESFSKPVEYRIPVYAQGQLQELKKSLKVTIPAGISDGDRIRVRGQGAPGPKITVPTLSGKISLTVKPNSQSGQKLRVPGKGLASRAGRGDLYVVLKVVMPQDASGDVQALWRQLAEQAAFDPRAEWGK